MNLLAKSIGVYFIDSPSDPDTAALMGESCRVMFSQIDEDFGNREKLVWFDEDMWKDMGSPREITVTIEPGDLLNT